MLKEQLHSKEKRNQNQLAIHVTDLVIRKAQTF
jgi:hypothetical protein